MVDMGGDDDSARLANLTNANLGGSPRITGGAGTDALVFDNVTTGGVARFDGWENIRATNDSELTFDGFLTLGDAGTGTGRFELDASSTIRSEEHTSELQSLMRISYAFFCMQ